MPQGTTTKRERVALSYDIDPQRAHVRIVGNRKVSIPAMIDAVEGVVTDPRFHADFTVILDLRQADYTPELSDGDAFAGELKKRKDDFRNKFAIVVPEELHFLAKLYCVLAKVGGFDRMRCFTDMQEATAWCQPPR